MSTAIARNFQIGIDPTPTNNFTLYQPATPDGTLRLGNGNTGITSSLLTLTSAGNLGIGTSSPTTRLDVNGTVTTTALTVNGNNISAASGFQKNKLINGNFDIWQRGTSLTNLGGGLSYLADRWAFEGMGSTAARVTYSRVADSPTISSTIGYSPFCARFTVTTTGGTATNDFGVLRQFIEGFNFEDLYQRAFTVSFWVKSSVTGTFGFSLYGGGTGGGQTPGTPSFTQTYTINAANTWEFKTIAVPACPAGTLSNWDFGNGRGLDVIWRLWSNAAAPSGTLGVWDTNVYSVPSFAYTNLAATNGATWQIAQVQIEVGTVATPFERRPYGTELVLCERYYEILSPIYVMLPWSSGTQIVRSFGAFRVNKRATPTINMGTKGTGAGIIGSLGAYPTGVVYFATGNIQDVIGYDQPTASAEL